MTENGYIALISMVAAFVVVMVVHAVSSTPSDEERTAEAARSARAWADRVGLRVTGVACERERCAVGVEGRAPVVVYCAGGACTVESCK